MSKNRVLITGCAGFIGSHYLDLLLEKDCVVFGVDKMTYAANEENIERHSDNKNFHFYKADICNAEYMDKLLAIADIDYVINFAAETHVDNSILGQDCFINSNIAGVKSLMEACKNNKFPICQISTDEVYGPIAEGSFVESDNLAPKNYYAATKAAAEHIVCAYSNTFDIPYTIIRMSNNYGPRQNSEKFLPTIIKSIKDGKKIPLYGDGKNVRDWIYVKDSVKIINEILDKNEFNNEVYNVAIPDEKTNIEVIQTVLNKMNLDWDEHVEFVKDRLGHDIRYSISDAKCKPFVNFTPTTFEEGIESIL